jgi:hypothetical protein
MRSTLECLEDDMLTHNEAAKLLATARSIRAGKPLANNTRLIKSEIEPEAFGVKLHDTEVVTIHADGTYSARTGGWRTYTTKDRINNYSPARVSQMNGVWYVTTSKFSCLFEEDVRVTADGELVGEMPSAEDTAKLEKAKRRVDRMVRKYIKGFVAEIGRLGEDFPNPGNGDCWGCLFVPVDAPRASKQDVVGVDHYFSHFEEKYYVPSLLWRAMQRRGNPSFCWQIMKSNPSFAADDLRWWFRDKKQAMAEYLLQLEETEHEVRTDARNS